MPVLQSAAHTGEDTYEAIDGAYVSELPRVCIDGKSRNADPRDVLTPVRLTHYLERYTFSDFFKRQWSEIHTILTACCNTDLLNPLTNCDGFE